MSEEEPDCIFCGEPLLKGDLENYHEECLDDEGLQKNQKVNKS